MSVEVESAGDFLLRAECPYTADAMCKSEMRILNQVDFHVNISTPVTYLEYCMYRVVDCIPDNILKEVYNLAVVALDYIFLERRILIDGIFDASNKNKHSIEILWSDFMFVSVASITVAVYLADNSITDTVSFIKFYIFNK